MKYYLIRFNYLHYCQGYEKASETVLVEADSFQEACLLILKKYKNVEDFVDLTLRVR